MNGLLDDRLGKLSAGLCVSVVLAMVLPVVTITMMGKQSLRGIDLAGFLGFAALVIGVLVIIAPKVPQIAPHRNLIALGLGALFGVVIFRLIYMLFYVGDGMGSVGMSFGDVLNMARDPMFGEAISIGYLGILAIITSMVLSIMIVLESWKQNKMTAPV